MKARKIILVLLAFGSFFISYSQVWYTSGNTLTPSSNPPMPIEYFGSNAATPNLNADIIFKRRGEFAGQIGLGSLSIGLNSFQNINQIGNSNQGTTAIGINAGKYNYNGVGQFGLQNTYVGFSAGK
jgi:hypothetical protein